MPLTKEERAIRENKIAKRDRKLRKVLPKVLESVNIIDDATSALDRAVRGKDIVDPRLVGKLQAALAKTDKALVKAHEAINEALN